MSYDVPVYELDDEQLIQHLEFQYHATVAANPDWDAPPLFDFLTERGVSEDAIWSHSPQVGYDADKPEPDWL